MKEKLTHVLNVLLLGAGLLAFAYLVRLERGRHSTGVASATSETPETTAVARRTKPAAPGPIRIGWTAWSDAEIVTNLARVVLEERMGYQVRLVMADIGVQYQGLATGELDAMLMAWLPLTHEQYWERTSSSVVNLGPIYTRARLGWAVPAYVSEEELDSLEDLKKPEVQRRLSGKIFGIDPGSGLMQASERAIEAYGLQGLTLLASSGAAMTAALERAVHRKEWIVVTAWNPHWMFAKWKLRYLKDPKRALGGRERVHVLVRKGFYQDFPAEVTEMLSRMYLPISELEEALLNASRTSVREAVDTYIREHPARVDYWVSGDLPTR